MFLGSSASCLVQLLRRSDCLCRTDLGLCDKKVPGSGINGRLSGDAKDIDDATKFITNFVSSLTRNKGSDYTAEWAKDLTDGKWYNEAFDGALFPV